MDDYMTIILISITIRFTKNINITSLIKRGANISLLDRAISRTIFLTPKNFIFREYLKSNKMDAKQLKGRLRRKIIMHMLFQIGGAVVILGALFKILHLEIGPITGGVVLGLGLGTEAIIFFVGGIMLDDVKEEQDEYVSIIHCGFLPAQKCHERLIASSRSTSGRRGKTC